VRSRSRLFTPLTCVSDSLRQASSTMSICKTGASNLTRQHLDMRAALRRRNMTFWCRRRSTIPTRTQWQERQVRHPSDWWTMQSGKKGGVVRSAPGRPNSELPHRIAFGTRVRHGDTLHPACRFVRLNLLNPHTKNRPTAHESQQWSQHAETLKATFPPLSPRQPRGARALRPRRQRP
jgi:hypothetical protein